MGSQAIQGQLWGRRANDWAEIQEKTCLAGYRYVLNYLQPAPGNNLLDIGCGAGLFTMLAGSTGANITGLDASEPLLEVAKTRNQSATFLTGEMEELPFADESFDIVCGINSFQYAADTQKALNEAARILTPGGKLAVLIWGDKAACEAATYLTAVGSLLPAPPAGAPGPFALSENDLLQQKIKAAGLTIVTQEDIDGPWEYPDMPTALKGLMSAGPVSRAIDHSGFDKVYNVLQTAVKPYQQDNGTVVYQNKFRVVIARK